MKILFVDIRMTGHHKAYFTALSELAESVLIAPCQKEDVDESIALYSYPYDGMDKSIASYLKWIDFIRYVGIKEKPDVIHFLYGDCLYRFFGFSLFKLNHWKVITTFHGIRVGILHNISIKRIIQKNDICVLHSKSQIGELERLNCLDKIAHVEYPCFSARPTYEKNAYRDFWGIPQDKKVLAAIGGTRRDKGLDILLLALHQVKEPFHLIIAGRPQDFTEEFIQAHIAGYSESVTCILRYLTDDELTNIVNCSDAIVLPYRKEFNGASGPLVEGVRWGKYIIGPNHGSLKFIIQMNCLGETFASENSDSLANTISRFLKEGTYVSKKAKAYSASLSVKCFQNKYGELYSKITNSK